MIPFNDLHGTFAEVGVSPDGILLGTLAGEPSLVEAGVIYQLSVYFTVINNKSKINSKWKKLEYYTNERKIGEIGNLSDILKEGAGFVVNDKILFGCEIVSCEKGGPD